VLQVASAQWTVLEQSGVARLTVMRTQGNSGPASVRYNTFAAAESMPPRFLPASGELRFESGELVKTIEIALVNDSYYRADTIFYVALSDASGAALGEETIAIVTIVDDEKKPSIRPSSASVQAWEADTPAPLPLDLILDAAMLDPVTVRWHADDFPAGEVTFAPGEVRKNGFMTLPGDDEYLGGFGGRVWFEVTSGLAEFVGNPVFVSVRDDDVSVATAADVQVDESAAAAVLTVTIARATPLPVVVQYTTLPQTAVHRATASLDYRSTGGSVTITPGETTAEIRIPLIDDDASEGSETFAVRLYGWAVAGPRDPIVTIIDDEPAPRRRSARH
ncbi:MAG TPA: Calx-beta domain-containing protein, partial [Thermoanaerobaculia bacterium]|nr:Calx-beta domain-containing protein [Thermoanaerobaculia bacterium]